MTDQPVNQPSVVKKLTWRRLVSLLMVVMGVSLGLGALAWIGAWVVVGRLGQTDLQTPTNNSPLGQLLSISPTPTPELVLNEIPSRKILPGGLHVFQTFNNCGPASLSMALSYFGTSVGQQTLGQALRPYQNPQGDNDDKSVTLEELAAKGEEYGLVAYHRPAGDIDLLQQLIALDLPVIARTYLRPGEDIGHYRVVKGYDQISEELIQDDSLQGSNLRYSYVAFDELWRDFSHEFLVLVPADKQVAVEQVLGELVDEQAAWRLALARAEVELAESPTSAFAQFNRSVALYHLGRFSESITAYEQVASQLPNRTLWYQIEPILAYFQAGQHDRVLQITQQVFDSQNRAFSELRQLRGLIYEERGQTELAQTEFALASQYNSANYWLTNL